MELPQWALAQEYSSHTLCDFERRILGQRLGIDFDDADVDDGYHGGDWVMRSCEHHCEYYYYYPGHHCDRRCWSWDLVQGE